MPFLLLLRTAAILQGSRSLSAALSRKNLRRPKIGKKEPVHQWLTYASSSVVIRVGSFFFFYWMRSIPESRLSASAIHLFNSLVDFFFFFYTRREKTRKFPPTPLRDDSQTHIYRDYYYVRTYREALIDFFFFVPPGRHRAWKFWLFFFFSCINIF